MIERFDHAVIAVRDLTAAAESYRVLGFGVEIGGRHTGAGTCNAIIRFGLDYLELIAVEDEKEASRTPRGAALVQFLQNHPAGPLGFALAATDLAALADRLRHAGLPVPEPVGMERMRPDGRLLTWSLLVPGQVAWRRPWPFFIEWSTPDTERLSWERPAQHSNGATRVAGVTVTLEDFDRGVDLYERQLGLAMTPHAKFAPTENRSAGFSLDGVQIDVIDSTSVHSARDGPGLGEIVLQTSSLDRTIGVLERAGARWERVAGDAGSLRVRSESAGARLLFVESGPA